MKDGLNWKEQMHWELYKQYLKTPTKTHVINYKGDGEVFTETLYSDRKPNECFRESKIAIEQFINGLAADARDELESSGWEERNFKAMVDSYEDKWKFERNGDCYNAVERALSTKPLNH